MTNLEQFVQSRRTFLKSIPGITAGVALILSDDEEAQAGLFLTFVGTLIVTEVVLGVLRAYNIDIARSVETFVRGFNNNKYNRYAVGQGSPFYERQISVRGKSQTGYCQCGEFGYTTQKYNEEPIWTPSINMWAATGNEESSSEVDLWKSRSGYPMSRSVKKLVKEKHHKYGYTELTQAFERGKTKIIIDHSKPETTKNIHKQNQNEKIWLS